MYCPECGKEIPDGVKFCPECGYQVTAVQQSQPPLVEINTEPASQTTVKQDNSAGESTEQKVPYNAMSIIGIVISGISLFLNFAGLVGIAGTIVSVIGLIQCKQKHENGQGLAIVGIIIGAISIVYGLAMISSL